MRARLHLRWVQGWEGLEEQAAEDKGPGREGVGGRAAQLGPTALRLPWLGSWALGLPDPDMSKQAVCQGRMNRHPRLLPKCPRLHPGLVRSRAGLQLPASGHLPYFLQILGLWVEIGWSQAG